MYEVEKMDEDEDLPSLLSFQMRGRSVNKKYETREEEMREKERTDEKGREREPNLERKGLEEGKKNQ